VIRARRALVLAVAFGILTAPLTVEAQPAGKIPKVGAAKKERAEAVLVLASGFFNAHRKRLATLAAEYRMPTFWEHRDFVDVGGLISYGPNIQDMYRRAAVYVDKILKGARPGHLPVEQPTKFELVVNLKTAKALGLTIPPSVLLRTDETIQ